MTPAPAALAMACLLAASAMPAGAQEGDELRNRVAIVENVRYDYAQVLNVEPVFQTLRATRTEEHCEPVSTLTLAPVEVKVEQEKGGFRRFWDSVKGLFDRADGDDMGGMALRPSGAGGNTALLTPECRIVEVGREFRRPIAYDVDYVYKGVKFRSRLPEDPGNRLKLRVSITPELGREPEPAGQ
ncbi:hypothetical protein [Stenotrophomonas mori]|uniref:Uncharacterized protein n=1 Tax=Stenotrophomonas mori TaxID=2871096 RepID=A0ABT0SEE7_9GAMM|nr:hypothetical protein [Stenotrophomonas mori]MCL7713671.1 hypothetical protein [Stenotrophomonas mori]